MASQWTIPKLVTWRVRDWASCFLASKIPLDGDGDEDGVNNNGNTTNNNNLRRIKKKLKSTKKKRSERKLSLSPPGTRHHHHHLRSSSVSPTSASHNRRLSWPPQPPVSDESGFIVFCFDREDGGFDVVKEGKQEKKDIELSPETSPRTVNRKLIYGDQRVGETEKNNSQETTRTEHEQNDSCQETEDVSSDVHEKTEGEEEEVDASDKSSGSNHSDEGRGSFAFPILGVEWMGSPVKMPESDDLSPKKIKPIALGFQCCRF